MESFTIEGKREKWKTLLGASLDRSDEDERRVALAIESIVECAIPAEESADDDNVRTIVLVADGRGEAGYSRISVDAFVTPSKAAKPTPGTITDEMVIEG